MTNSKTSSQESQLSNNLLPTSYSSSPWPCTNRGRRDCQVSCLPTEEFWQSLYQHHWRLWFFTNSTPLSPQPSQQPMLHASLPLAETQRKWLHSPKHGAFQTIAIQWVPVTHFSGYKPHSFFAHSSCVYVHLCMQCVGACVRLCVLVHTCPHVGLLRWVDKYTGHGCFPPWESQGWRFPAWWLCHGACILP